MFVETERSPTPRGPGASRTGATHLNHGRFLQPDPIGYESGLNLYGYVLGDPINLVDPNGLVPVCRADAPAYRLPNGDIVVTAIRCYDDGRDLSELDQAVHDFASARVINRGDEAFFSVLPDRIIPVAATSRTQCRGSTAVTYRAPAASFMGGDPGHYHSADYDPGIGPDDGLAARQGPRGIANVGTLSGTYRVQRHSATDYSVTRLGGDWNSREVIGLIERWNQHDGQTAATPQARGGGRRPASSCWTRPLGGN